jgi:hypothetical protein
MTNPLLAKIKLPGRIFQLPSKGIFYMDGVLAEHVKDGEVEVKPLSAFAEMKLRSPDMLFTGRAVREICLECIPDILKPEKLVSKDIDAVFCFLKIVTYGNIMTVKSIHGCNRVSNTYNVDIENIVMNPNNGILDHVDSMLEETLTNGQKVRLKPVIFQDTIVAAHLRQEVEKKLEAGITDQDLMEKTMVHDIMSVIHSVDGITDEVLIEEWVKSLQRKFFNEIIDKAQSSAEWGFNLTTKLTCKDCGAEYDHNLELNPINFFSG